MKSLGISTWLAIVAGLIALGAALSHYLRTGSIDWRPLAGGLVLLGLAGYFSMQNKTG